MVAWSVLVVSMAKNFAKSFAVACSLGPKLLWVQHGSNGIPPSKGEYTKSQLYNKFQRGRRRDWMAWWVGSVERKRSVWTLCFAC